MSDQNKQEIELKLEISEVIYNTILDKFKTNTLKSIYQENYFFDTGDRKLSRLHWALRIRIQDKRQSVLTVKGKAQLINGMYIRPEHEEEIPLEIAKTISNGFNLADYYYEPIQFLFKIAGNQYLTPFMNFKNHRTVIMWNNWTLEIDKTEMKDKIFYELEVECTMSRVAALKSDLEIFFNANSWEFKISSGTKFDKALQVFGIEDLMV